MCIMTHVEQNQVFIEFTRFKGRLDGGLADIFASSWVDRLVFRPWMIEIVKGCEADARKPGCI